MLNVARLAAIIVIVEFVGGSCGSAGDVTAVSTPGPAAAISINAGNNQTALVGSVISIPLSVKVVDARGKGVAGVPVFFDVATGAGSLAGSIATSDNDGLASLGSWTLGLTAGPNTV